MPHRYNLLLDTTSYVEPVSSAGDAWTISGTSPAAPGTAVLGSVVTGLGGYTVLGIHALLLGATAGALDVYLQGSMDGGTTWFDVAHFPQLAAGAAAIRYAATLTRYTQATAPVVVGINLTPALAVNTLVQGSWGDRLRAVCVAGASTSAGAALSILGYANT